jgi:hypothetical protein
LAGTLIDRPCGDVAAPSVAHRFLAKMQAVSKISLAQVMHGGYIAGTFSQSDTGSPECRHIVDVSEAC